VPELDPVHILPESLLVRKCLRVRERLLLDPPHLQDLGNKSLDMAGVAGVRARMVEANGDWQVVLFAQGRKKPGVEQRRLSRARRAENNCEHLAPDEPQQLDSFLLTAEEQLRV